MVTVHLHAAFALTWRTWRKEKSFMSLAVVNCFVFFIYNVYKYYVIVVYNIMNYDGMILKTCGVQKLLFCCFSRNAKTSLF